MEWDWLPATASPNQGNDWGGVHTNSGIPNKAAYLLIQGDVHNGIVVDALGPNKVGQLYLDVLRRQADEKLDVFGCPKRHGGRCPGVCRRWPTWVHEQRCLQRNECV